LLRLGVMPFEHRQLNMRVFCDTLNFGWVSRPKQFPYSVTIVAQSGSVGCIVVLEAE